MMKMHSQNKNDASKTRCGLYMFSNEMTDNNEYVTCKNCLINIRNESDRREREELGKFMMIYNIAHS